VTALRLPGLDVPVTGRLLRLGVAGDDRAAIVGDVLRRVAELNRLRVHVSRDGADRLHLNVPAADAPLSSAVDVTVGGAAVPSRHSVPTPRWTAPAGADPLAARLLVLNTPVDAQVGTEGLPAAEAELSAWRGLVARWAEAPSGALPPAADDVRAAAANGLDTPLAIERLRTLLVDETVSPGSRFEALLSLDRVLGLDLADGLTDL
jgi:hypothetical protein